MRHSADLMLPEVRNGQTELGKLLPYARVHRMPRYDPDKDFVESKAPELVQTLDMDDEQTEVWAKLLEVNPRLWAEARGSVDTVYGRREHGRFVESADGTGRPLRPWRQGVYGTKEALWRRVTEARARMAGLREGAGKIGAYLREQGADDLFSLGGFFATQPTQQIGSEMGGWLNSEYQPMMVGPFTRQLYLYDLLDMHRKAFEVVNHNPIARAIVSITSTFVLGKGVTAVCEDDQAQDIWDSFVAENDLWHRLRTWVDELAIYGELMPRWAYDRHARSGIVRSVDPATVWEIVTEPVDIEHVYYYWQQYPTQYQIYTAPGVPYTRYVIEQIPAEQIIHVKVNCTSGEKRGRSDLFSILGWLKRTKDYYTAEVQRAQAAASFMWDDTVKGNLSDVMAHLAFIGSHPPQPGDVFVHNESVIREFTVSKTPTRSLGDTGHSLIAICGVGAGVPKEYLSVSAAGARATALVATEPAAKRFEDRQYTVEFLLTQLAHKVFRAAGLLRFVRDKGVVQDRWAVEFTFPSIATEDRSAKLNDLNVSEANAWVSHETSAGIAAKELGITTYDYDTEMDKIQEEIGVDPRTVISGKIPMIRKLETTTGVVAPAPPKGTAPGETQPMPGPDGRPAAPPAGNGAGALRGPTRMTTGQRAENNPLAPEGAAALRKDLSQKEAEGAVAVAEPETRRTREAKIRPGYRNKWGRQVEAAIAAAQDKARKTFIALLMAAVGGDENEDVSLTRSQLTNFGRTWSRAASDALLKAGSAAYMVGVAKAKEQAGGDRATPALHTSAVQEWHQKIRSRVDRLQENMERWYDREFKTEGTVPTGDDLRGRFETPAMTIPAGLWTLYQSGFQNALGGAGLDASGEGAAGPVMLDYIAVGDEDTCAPCAEAAEGGPYAASEAPLPGDVCDGGDNCRCELELAE